MILRAIENDHYVWLNYIWAFKKNYTLKRGASSQDDRNIKVTLQDLFGYIIQVCKEKMIQNKTNESDDVNCIRTVCDWMLDFSADEAASSSKGS